MFKNFLLIFVFCVCLSCSHSLIQNDCNPNIVHYTSIYEDKEYECRITKDSIPIMTFYDFGLSYIIADFDWSKGFLPPPKGTGMREGNIDYMDILTDTNTVFLRYTDSNDKSKITYLSKKNIYNDFFYVDIASYMRTNDVHCEYANVLYKDEKGCVQQAYYLQFLKQNTKDSKWLLVEGLFNVKKFANKFGKDNVNLPANADLRTSFKRHYYKIPFKRSVQQIIDEYYQYSKIL